MKKLRTSISLGLHKFPKTDVVEYIRQGLIFHKKVGFDAVDFPSKLINYLEDDWKAIIEKTLRISQEVGIKIEQCHLPYSVAICTHPEELPSFNAKVHEAIDAAAMLGVDYAVLHPNTTTVPLDGFNRKAEYDSVMAHLAPFVEHAEKVNVKLAVENMRLVHCDYPTHRYCQDPDELCEIADALGIGVCWDFGHANTCALVQSEALSYIGSRLKALHVNDNNSIGDDHILPFCGTVDWEDAMKGLGRTGFDGLFNYEIGAKNVPGSMRELYAKYLVESAREMMKHI